VFQGSSALILDAKGRLSIPTRHRDALCTQVGGALTLTRHRDKCLLVYPRPEWEAKRAEIDKFPMSADWLKRLLLGNAQDVDIDGSGRILIAPELRDAAGMTREVMLLGMGSYFELWDAGELKRREAEDATREIPDALASFSF